jgi:hypothetical protein
MMWFLNVFKKPVLCNSIKGILSGGRRFSTLGSDVKKTCLLWQQYWQEMRRTTEFISCNSLGSKACDWPTFHSPLDIGPLHSTQSNGSEDIEA